MKKQSLPCTCNRRGCVCPRFKKFGLVNAHTGKRKKKTYDTRAAAEAAQFTSGDHALRVRGVSA